MSLALAVPEIIAIAVLGWGSVAVLGKNIWGPCPSSFGRQPRLSEITIEPISGVLPKI